MVIDQTWISLTSALTALIASIAGPFVTLRVGRQQFKANVLSVNRQRWIESLRDAVASLIAQVQVAASLKQILKLEDRTAIAADAVLLSRLEDLTRTVARIDLLLNPTEADHNRLRSLMETALGWLRSDKPQPDLFAMVDDVANEIVRTSQHILKSEWIRVKRGN